MKRIIKITCLLLCSVILCSCGANEKEVKKKTTVSKDVASIPYRLLYCSTDSVNPYKALTQANQEIGFLLFDPLIKLDENFAPVYCIAASAENSQNTCTVHLNSYSFTDGTPLTANDVVFSANLAKNSARYSSGLSNVSSCVAADEKTVVFTLYNPDPYFINLLDFPVIKTGSDTLVNEDNLSLPPIGCGRYTFDMDNEILTANENYYGGAAHIKSLRLLDAPDDESVSQRIRSGEVLVHYSDLSGNDMPNMNGKAKKIPLTNIVYIGCNMNSNIFKNVYARQAVSSAINRASIVKTAYFNNAQVACGPFPANWKPAEKAQNLLASANRNLGVENFDRLGYNKDDEGFYILQNGNRLTVSLLVNSENNSRRVAADMIASQLENIGLEVNVNYLSYDSYMAALSSGSFDLYLAEVRIGANMDLGPLVKQGGACAYGIASNSAEIPAADGEEQDQTALTPEEIDKKQELKNATTLTVGNAVTEYANGAISLQDLITIFNTELPVIPVCHRCGILLYNEHITTTPKSSVSDIYFNFEKFSVK